MSYLYETLDSLEEIIDFLCEISKTKSNKTLIDIINDFTSELNRDVTSCFDDNKEKMNHAICSEDVMQNLLSLIYFQAIEACLKMMISVFQYVINNCQVIVPNSTRGIFADRKVYAFPVSFVEISESYNKISEVIGHFWSGLIPKEEGVERKFGEYFKIIKKIHDEINTPSYNHNECTFRFLISAILVCLMAENDAFEPIPQQRYYHSGQKVKSISMYDLLKSKHYDIFRITMFSTLFEFVNSGLSGEFDKKLYIFYFELCYYNCILNNFIPIQKDKPKEGLVRLYNITKELLEFINYWRSKIPYLFLKQ